eukprot:366390-Chlamydomonas_euryale.AAC.29
MGSCMRIAVVSRAVNANPSHSMAGKSVLEIGAGTGAVGLVAAGLGAAPVVLTDLPHLLPFMEANIRVSAGKWP